MTHAYLKLDQVYKFPIVVLGHHTLYLCQFDQLLTIGLDDWQDFYSYIQEIECKQCSNRVTLA